MAYRKPISVSRPPSLAKEVERFAKRQHQTVSELVRAALRDYISRATAWRDTLAYGRKRAKELNIRTEEDVYRIMHELGHGSSAPPHAAARRR